MTNEVLVQAENICKYFKIGGGRMLHAVEDVSLSIHRGETLGLVGESGCGKSTLGRTLMGIYRPTKGQAVYAGKEVDLTNKNERLCLCQKCTDCLSGSIRLAGSPHDGGLHHRRGHADPQPV